MSQLAEQLLLKQDDLGLNAARVIVFGKIIEIIVQLKNK